MENLIARSKDEKTLYHKLLNLVERDGLELLRIRIFNEFSLTLQIMLDHKGRDVTINDCAKVSKVITRELENQSIIDAKYQIEISSPGLNRPLTRNKDFEKWKGCNALIVLNSKDSKLQTTQGKIIGLKDSDLLLQQNDKVVYIKLCNIDEAELVA